MVIGTPSPPGPPDVGPDVTSVNRTASPLGGAGRVVVTVDVAGVVARVVVATVVVALDVVVATVLVVTVFVGNVLVVAVGGRIVEAVDAFEVVVGDDAAATTDVVGALVVASSVVVSSDVMASDDAGPESSGNTGSVVMGTDESLLAPSSERAMRTATTITASRPTALMAPKVNSMFELLDRRLGIVILLRGVGSRAAW
jgi:hypothetical protein